MGKYMKKGKITGGGVVMELPQIGVRTRARSLALQPNPELSYLQLRNRRLEKPFFPPSLHSPTRSEPETCCRFATAGVVDDNYHVAAAAAAACFGENLLDFDSIDRGTRESTPCSLIRDADAIGTPGSSTRPTCSATARQRARNMQRAIPTTHEMEDFFAGFELHQQELFLQKYNYDIVNDIPRPGRYEWVRVDN